MIDTRHKFLFAKLAEYLQKGIDLFAIPEQDYNLEACFLEAITIYKRYAEE